MDDTKFCVDYAKCGAGCKVCKVKIEKGCLRIGKVIPNPFSDTGGDMKQWFHVKCIFCQLSRARASTKKIEDPKDFDGWDQIKPDDRKLIIQFIKDLPDWVSGTTLKKESKIIPKNNISIPSPTEKELDNKTYISTNKHTKEQEGKDGEFRAFRSLCADITNVSSYLEKTRIVSDFFEKGSSGKGFCGNIFQWVRLLLPGVHKIVYHVQSKQLIKLFSQLFNASQNDMFIDLEQGDIAETVRLFFEKSENVTPLKKSNITLTEVEDFLTQLSQVTKKNDQTHVLKNILKRCTGNDLKMIVRLIKHDLRINAGPKHILEALHPSAYEAFQASRNLGDVIERFQEMKQTGAKELSVRATLMTPVIPMLAEACKSVDYAYKKCPNGMFAEIKYDGERVQLHHQGDSFNFFSRSLKPVMSHKVSQLKEFIPKAFPKGTNFILDSEVLMIDTSTGKPLPFGTLGKYKKETFKDASVCLFVFDCLHYNGENLMNKSFSERRRTLEKNMTVIPNHVVFSEIVKIEEKKELKNLIANVISQGLEGLVLKDGKGKYEPGKRHWLKIKKDYLEQGAMADTADLMVLGAYFGTGNKGGMMSSFLMGCWDSENKWCTVCKVHGGHDDDTLEKLQTELDMIKISKDPNKVPSWLDVTRTLVPDFVSRDPKKSQVWEITGTEFTCSNVHTACGISIRFPRVTKIRNDKRWEEATSVDELKVLFKNSKTTSDFKGIQAHNGTKRCSSKDDDKKSLMEDESDTKDMKQQTHIKKLKKNW